MKKPKGSRAFDPTYKPTKSWQQLWEEAGRPAKGGLAMMADRERTLTKPQAPASARIVSILSRRRSKPR